MLEHMLLADKFLNFSLMLLLCFYAEVGLFFPR